VFPNSDGPAASANLWAKREILKYQLIAGAGLAAVITFCGYMVVQLDHARADSSGGDASRVTIADDAR
jgi:hypothetical protein